MPSKMRMTALESETAGACSSSFWIAPSSASRRQMRDSRGGALYSVAGSTSRTREISSSTRRRLSMILPCSLTRMTLENRPMISATSVRTTESPSSLLARTEKRRMRSSPSCSIASSLPPLRCLRSSIQNIGGCAGFSGAVCVMWTREASAEAENSTRDAPPFVRKEITSVSREG